MLRYCMLYLQDLCNLVDEQDFLWSVGPRYNSDSGRLRCEAAEARLECVRMSGANSCDGGK